MAKLINLIPGRKIQKEDLEDMDVAIPANIERFLDRAVKAIKSYNLSRKKEQYVIAKLIDSLDMTPSDLQQAVSKLKKYKIVKK
jgi:hypothetical protein